jgi:hypothetical protein
MGWGITARNDWSPWSGQAGSMDQFCGRYDENHGLRPNIRLDTLSQ